MISYAQTIDLLKKKKVFAKISKGGWPSAFNKGALLYEGDTKLAGMRLDHGFPIDRRKGTPVPDAVIVDGDLVVDGVIENGEQDFGPGLIVLGNLDVKNAAVGGAPLWVCGNLRVRGAFHGYYNHGMLDVFGNVDAKLFIADDYFVRLRGKNKGTFIDDRGSIEGKVPKAKNIAKVLAKRFFKKEDDEIDLESGAIYKALVAGKSLRP